MVRTRSSVVRVPELTNAVIGGLVASCACCTVIPLPIAPLVGLIASLLTLSVEEFLVYAQVDDAVGAVSQHVLLSSSSAVPLDYDTCMMNLWCMTICLSNVLDWSWLWVHVSQISQVKTRHSKYGISNERVLNKNVCQAHACSIWSCMQCSVIFERQRHNKITFQGLHVKETLWADASSHIAAANDCHRLPKSYWEQVPSANVSLKTEPWEIQLLLFEEQWGKIHFWNIENTYEHINYKKHSDLIWSLWKAGS